MTYANEVNESTTHNSDKRKKSKFAIKEEITQDNCHFTEGQLLKFVNVRFPGHAKSYAFLIGHRNVIHGQKIMAMSDRGMAVGYINSFIYELPFQSNMLPLRSINKTATSEDIETEKQNYKKQKEIETFCHSSIEKHKLDMNLTHVEFTQFGKKVVFYFIAPARVDFRGLVKDLVTELRLRIELRQISVRDRAASQGALGSCGRELCCSSFLSKYGNVSIKMAKNQNLTLNYSKLNGVCGQLKCCLQYEDEVYAQKRKKLPSEGSLVETLSGESGKIRKLFILNEQFELLTDKGKIKRYTFDQLKKIYKNSEYQFPRSFDNISDETGQVIGLSELESKISKQFQRDIEEVQSQAKVYAKESIESIAEFLPERDRTQDDIKEVPSPKKELAFSPAFQAEASEILPETKAHLNTDPTSPSEEKKKTSPKRNRNRNSNRNQHRRNKTQNKKTE